MSRKVKFQGSTDDCEQSQHNESIGWGWQWQRMLMNIAGHMDLTIMQPDKTFGSTRLQRIFGRSNCIRRILWDIWSTGDERIPDKCEELFVGVFRRKRSCKATGAKDSQKITKYFRVFCSNKSNWRRYGRQVYVAIHGDLSVVGNCNGEGHKGLGTRRGVSSESSDETVDHLWWRGSPGWSGYENLMSELVKSLTRIEERSESQSIDEE